MDKSVRHVCMIPKMPTCTTGPPTANIRSRITCKIQKLVLPASWHHGTVIFIRSMKSLELERMRQLKCSYWFLWHPYSCMKFVWDTFTMVVTLSELLYMPCQVFFYCPNPFDPIILFGDLVAFLDVLSMFITGYTYEDDKKVVLEPKKIALHYIKGTFFFDLIGTLPLQLYQPFEKCLYPTHTIMFLVKLLRIIQLRPKWGSILEHFKMSYPTSVILTIFVRLIFFFHWVTYVHYQIPAFYIHFYSMSQKEVLWLKRFKVDTEKSPFEKYITNLYFAAGICIGAGYYSPISEHIIPEMVLNSVMGIGGLLFLTFCFMNLLRLALYSRYQNFLYYGRMHDLQRYMIFKRLPEHLQEKIKRFINYKFYNNYLNEYAIINTINEQMHQDINMHCCRQLVTNVPLFRDMPVALINSIIFSLKRETVMSEEVIIKYGEPGDCMYFIYFGTVAIIDGDGNKSVVSEGAWFGEAALLRAGAPRDVTAVAQDITELFVLRSEELRSCIQPYPHLKRRLARMQTE